MDPTKKRDVRARRENYSEGHDITYEVSALKLIVLKSWPFTKTYKTDCQYFRTSWDLRVDFLEIRENASISLFISLKRSDSENIDPEACIWVQICDPHDHLIFPKQSFERERMMANDELQETVEILAFPDRREAINGPIVVHISIMVCFCHNDADSSSSMSVSSETIHLDID